MYNYLKCKYDLDFTESEKESIGRDLETLTYLCDPVLGNVGEFLIRGNGELCHSVTDYEKVDDSEVGAPNVIWNGSCYARIKNTEWVRVPLTDKLKIETQLISKKTDASIKVDLEFVDGYVVNHSTNLILIDNTERLAHDKKIKEIAIKRAEKFNRPSYRLYNKLFREPFIKTLRSIRYVMSIISDTIWTLEKKVNKQ